MMKRAKMLTVVVMLLAISVAAQANVNLFTDTFGDELGDINGQPNASVSGSFALTNANNYTGRGSGSYTETGGVATVGASADKTSAMLISIHDFATDSDVQSSGTITISLTDFALDGSDWLALNVMTSIPSGINTAVNQSYTAIGALFSSGATQAFTYGGGISNVDSWSDDDVSIVLTNIVGLGTSSGSFDYEILSGTVSLVSGSTSGDLSSLYIGIESRSGDSTVSELAVSTIPEPATMAILGLGALMIRRKR